MKVLIYGEYSGFGRSLAQGFKYHEHAADVFSISGDGWKSIDVDISLNHSTRIGKFIKLISLLPRFLTYDKVLIMNPYFLEFRFLGPLVLFLFWIFRKDVYLLCCGDDVEYVKRGTSGELKNWVYAGIELPQKKYFSKKSDIFINYLCANIAKKIIPVMYDYSFCWQLSKYNHKVTKTIPLACDGSINQNICGPAEQINILHGINREDVKGSNIIVSALNRIADKYPMVKIHTPKHLPFHEYAKLMKKMDISVDQCKSNSYGMNGIYAMLNGNILVSSFTLESRLELDALQSPVVSVPNNEEGIFKAIETILNSVDLCELKTATAKYAESKHSPSQVVGALIQEMK